MKTYVLFIIIIILSSCGSISSNKAAQLDQPNASSVFIPQGIFSTSSNGTPIPQSILENPSVTGFLIHDSWASIEYQEDTYDWAHLDSEIARAAAHDKLVRLAVHIGGDDVPAWVLNDSSIKLIFEYDKVSGDKYWVPAF